MAKKAGKKVTTVREHPMHVSVSQKNPTGITIRDKHLRRIKGTYLDAAEIEEIFINYDRKNIAYPTKKKLIQPDSDKSDGEVKDFIFRDIRKKDLKNPSIAIPIAIRWLSRKKRLAEGKLGRSVTGEEIILEYKGLLKSKSPFKNKAVEKFRKEYGALTKK